MLLGDTAVESSPSSMYPAPNAVVFALYPGVQPLDVTGPHEVFHAACSANGLQSTRSSFRVAAAPRGNRPKWWTGSQVNWLPMLNVFGWKLPVGFLRPKTAAWIRWRSDAVSAVLKRFAEPSTGGCHFRQTRTVANLCQPESREYESIYRHPDLSSPDRAGLCRPLRGAAAFTWCHRDLCGRGAGRGPHRERLPWHDRGRHVRRVAKPGRDCCSRWGRHQGAG